MRFYFSSNKSNGLFKGHAIKDHHVLPHKCVNVFITCGADLAGEGKKRPFLSLLVLFDKL